MYQTRNNNTTNTNTNNNSIADNNKSHSISHTATERRQALWFNRIVMVLACVGVGGGLLQWPTGCDAASLSIPITDSQLRMLRVLEILAKTENHNEIANHHNDVVLDDDADDDDDDTDSLSNDLDIGLQPLELSYDRMHHHDSMYELGPVHRVRHRKRQSDPFFATLEASQNVEWSNPCGGVFEEDNSIVEERPSRREFLSLLRITSYGEYQGLTDRQRNISVDDIKQWQKHKDVYKFLPTMNSNKISLKRWYRKMQVYVAAFAYLGNAQHKYEQSIQRPTSEITYELKELLISARKILCDLEVAINGSYTRTVSQEKLISFTRAEMNEKLKAFYTKLVPSHQTQDIEEAATQDLKFAKYRYLEFLQHMYNTLEKNLKQHDDHMEFSDSSGSSAAVGDDNRSLGLHEMPLRPNNKRKQRHNNNNNNSANADDPSQSSANKQRSNRVGNNSHRARKAQNKANQQPTV